MSTNLNTTTLGHLLDSTQLTEVEKIVSKIRSNNAPTVDLRDYLRTQSESLERRGVLPDYLYYSLAYHLQLPL